jgi:DNA processing protein
MVERRRETSVSERKYWVGFSIVRGIGPVGVRRLREGFGSLEKAWRANAAELRAVGLNRRAAHSLIEARSRIDLDAEMTKLDRQGVAALTWEDADYPPRLQEIHTAPPVLYVRGSLDVTDEWAIAIVGTRRVSAYGRQVTYRLASELAANGVTIVSGLARGVDGEAHRAALEVGGRTIAVLASGLDIVYPPEHRDLAKEIVQNGALVSELPLGSKPEAGNFPARNRIISGLALGVLITEAGDRSGALITVGHATEQGRDVFAVPGNITAGGSKGVNRLLQEGAKAVLSAQDILDELDLARVTGYVEARESLPVTGLEATVLAELSEDPLHVDDIRERCNMPVAEVSSTLAMLELKGLARQVGNMIYVRA